MRAYVLHVCPWVERDAGLYIEDTWANIGLYLFKLL